MQFLFFSDEKQVLLILMMKNGLQMRTKIIQISEKN